VAEPVFWHVRLIRVFAIKRRLLREFRVGTTVGKPQTNGWLSNSNTGPEDFHQHPGQSDIPRWRQGVMAVTMSPLPMIAEDSGSFSGTTPDDTYRHIATNFPTRLQAQNWIVERPWADHPATLSGTSNRRI